ncbi:MAG: DUF4113 domain-containing protein [Acidobacteria bacterium]|nr:DUF4113 domain-containing protein [Acidobacteriota bacterium]
MIRKQKRLCQAIDKLLRKFRKEIVSFGFSKAEKTWKMKAGRKLNCYTTCLQEILQVR